MLRVVYYSSLCQLLRVLLLSWCVGGIIVLRVLVSILASYIYILGYLLGHPPSKANLLVLLFLFLRVLLLYFLSLLGLLRALRCLPPIVLTTVKPYYTVHLGSRGFKRYAVWKRYIASSLINRRKGLNQLFSLSITT